MSDDKYSLPEGWVWTTLGQICEKPQYGWTTSADFNGKGLKLLRTTDISSGKIDWDTVPFCKQEPDEPKKYILCKGDILVSRAGSVGISIEIDECPKAIFASYLIRFKPLSSIPSKYISLYLKSPYYWNSIADNTAGIAIPNVNASKLQQLDIPIPPSNEQVHIIAKIETLLDRLNKTNQELAKIPPLLKKLRQSVLAKAFSGDLTKDIRKESKECTWQQKKLKDICEDVKSINLLIYPEKVYRYIDISSISNTTNEIQGLREFVGKHAPSRARRPAQKNDILFSNVRTYLKNIVLVKFDDSNLLCSTGFCVLRPQSMIRSEFLFYRVLSDEFIDKVTETQTGTHYPATSDRKVLSMEIALPPLDEQDVIIRRIKKTFEKLSEIEKKYKIAGMWVDKLSQSILAKAFKGELVPQEK